MNFWVAWNLLQLYEDGLQTNLKIVSPEFIVKPTIK